MYIRWLLFITSGFKENSSFPTWIYNDCGKMQFYAIFDISYCYHRARKKFNIYSNRVYKKVMHRHTADNRICRLDTVCVCNFTHDIIIIIHPICNPNAFTYYLLIIAYTHTLTSTERSDNFRNPKSPVTAHRVDR